MNPVTTVITFPLSLTAFSPLSAEDDITWILSYKAPAFRRPAKDIRRYLRFGSTSKPFIGKAYWMELRETRLT